jgi:Rrf2 family protein
MNPSPFISPTARLALAAVVAIATKSGPQPMPASTLTGVLKVNRRALEIDLQALRRAGVLRGTRGPTGGYQLARPAREIGLGEIVRVSDALRPGAGDVLPALVADVVDPMLDFPSRRFAESLDAITVADMVARAAAR